VCPCREGTRLIVIDIGQAVRSAVMRGKVLTARKEIIMHKQLATLALGMLLAMPYMATGTSHDRGSGSMPAAVDQHLAKDMIQQAETQLKLAGFDPGRVDGVFDMRTAQAVRHYQVAHALPVSGELDAPTRRVLFPGFHDADED